MSATIYALVHDPGRTTRDCMEPWFFAQVTAEGGVKPCCIRAAIGNLNSGETMGDLLDGPEIRTLREQLVTGALEGLCITCPTHALTDLGGFRLRLRVELAREASR